MTASPYPSLRRACPARSRPAHAWRLLLAIAMLAGCKGSADMGKENTGALPNGDNEELAADVALVLSVSVLSEGIAGQRSGVIRMTYHNAGSKPLWIPMYLSPTSPTFPARYRHVWLRVVDPRGRDLEYVPRGTYLETSTPDEFMELAPGAQVHGTVDLGDLYWILDPGRHEILAYFDDTEANAPPAPPGTYRVGHRVRSNAAIMEVRRSSFGCN